MNNPKFQPLLVKYLNQGWLNKADALLSIFFPGIVFEKNAAKLQTAYQGRKLPPATETFQHVSIPVYDGKNPGVLQMRDALKPIQGDLLAAILHGSLATDEKINYSDFDGLLIVRDEVFKDKRRLAKLAKAVYETRKIMNEIDPFQHHGWFVLTETDLLSYPVNYLPVEVLHHAKSLFPPTDVDIKLKAMIHADYYSPVKAMCRRIRKMSQASNRPRTLYQLKSLLSEFMLLPALYIQARDQRGIFKKFSFTAAAADFNLSTWSIMEEVSRIRAEWPPLDKQEELNKFRKIGYIWNQYRKRKGPSIPAVFAGRLNDDFYQRMAELANQVEVNLFR